MNKNPKPLTTGQAPCPQPATKTTPTPKLADFAREAYRELGAIETPMKDLGAYCYPHGQRPGEKGGEE